MNSIGESKHPCLAINLRGKTVVFSTIKYNINYRLFRDTSYQVRKSFLVLGFYLETFIRNGCLVLPNVLSVPIKMIIHSFFFLFGNTVNHIVGFLNMQPILHPSDKLHLVMIYVTLFLYTTVLNFNTIQNFILNFAPIFIKDIHLYFFSLIFVIR